MLDRTVPISRSDISPEVLGTRTKAGFLPTAENGIKVVLTT